MVALLKFSAALIGAAFHLGTGLIPMAVVLSFKWHALEAASCRRAATVRTRNGGTNWLS